MRLKQATTVVPFFSSVQQTAELSEALAILRAEQCDVVFLSHQLSDEKVEAFIRQAKSAKGGASAAYILLLRGMEQEYATVAAEMRLGVDGFLFEPYSADQLTEISALAAEIKRARHGARERLALRLQLSETVRQIDLIAFLKSGECACEKSMRRLRWLCEGLKTYADRASEHYYEMLFEAFTEAVSPEERFSHKAYSGVSERVKRRVQRMIAEEIEKNEALSPASAPAQLMRRVVIKKKV